MRTLSDIALVGTATSVRLSGHAIDGSENPVVRTQRLFDVHGSLLQTVVSDGATGAYSFTVSGNTNDQFDVVGVPEPGEKSPSYNAVVGVIV